MMKEKVCLLSITASHYRTRIYDEMQKHMDCDFIFGIENTSVKRMDTSILKTSTDITNKYIGGTNWYYQPNVVRLTKKYSILINDLGIFSITAWVLLIMSKFRGQKVYNWDHGWYGRENLIKKIIKRLYFGLATGSFIYGDYAINLMSKNGFNSKKLFPIHNSLDYDSQLAIRKNIKKSDIYSKHFGNNYPVLIMIGRLNLRKKLNMLIEAVAELHSIGQEFNVVMIGDGEDRKSIEQLIEQNNINKQVWLYGACYDEIKNAELLYNADMCVVPGDIGLTAIHAMMFGVPVITHDYFPNQGPEFEAIKDGITGSFYKHGNIKSLSATISRWFSSNDKNREETRRNCENEIDTNWTPAYQLNILKTVIYG